MTNTPNRTRRVSLILTFENDPVDNETLESRITAAVECCDHPEHLTACEVIVQADSPVPEKVDDTMEFKSRIWYEVTPEIKLHHRTYPRLDLKNLETPLNDPRYTWIYFGKQKYGRYAVCDRTKTKRGLTLPEFYGTSEVD
jgi:hypothetical protein